MPTDYDGHDAKLSIGQVKNVMHGVSDRVSQDAAIRMAIETEEKIERKTRAAKLFADHAGRKTVKEEDVRKVEKIAGIFGALDGE